MNFGYLHVRTGPHRILLPGDLVIKVDPPAPLPPRLPWTVATRRGAWPILIDSRRILDLPPSDDPDVRIVIHWRAASTPVRIAFDAVEGLRAGFEREFLPLPRVPLPFERLFDGLIHESDGGFLLRLRRDAQPASPELRDRKRLLRAVSALDPTYVLPEEEAA